MPGSKKARAKKTPPGAMDGRFVGRESSPILDKYPPKDPSLSPTGPPRSPASPPRTAAPTVPVEAGSTTGGGATASKEAAPAPLITLERPFNVDEFAGMLGETSIRVTVPRENLSEVLARATEFMGFGIYVYSITVRPAPSDLLKAFVVELQRVDYSADRHDWVPFQDKGTSDSPFGPGGNRG
jgi:hypothetical protein